MSTVDFNGRVAIVTGAAHGLGRAHALELAKRGAKVVVNDLGATVDGSGANQSAAESTAEDIRKLGGEALTHGADVCNPEQVGDLVEQVMNRWGRIDILVNNAGILRDKSFSKMSLEDFRAVFDVHVMGAVICTKAVWPIMKTQNYGRVVMTTSSSGLYGNFGQSNYGAAKLALVGLMNTLSIEGAKNGIKINALSPVAATRMTENLPGMEAAKAYLAPESATAALVVLAAEDAPNRLILCAGGGGYAAARIYETEGVYLSEGEQTPENIMKKLDSILEPEGQRILEQGAEQTMKFLQKAMS